MRMTKLRYLRVMAKKDHSNACEWAQRNMPEFNSFCETWASHCGAPRDVFIGHTVALLASLDSSIYEQAELEARPVIKRGGE